MAQSSGIRTLTTGGRSYQLTKEDIVSSPRLLKEKYMVPTEEQVLKSIQKLRNLKID